MEQVVNTKEKEVNSLKQIVIGGPVVRSIASVIDLGIILLIAIGLFFLLSYLVFTPIAKATGVVDYDQFEIASREFMDLQVESGLFYYDEENERTDIYNDYESYEDYDLLIQNYYFTYLPSKLEVSEASKYTNYWYNVFVYGLDDEKNLYPQSELDARFTLVKEKGAQYFTYKTSGEDFLYDELADLKATLFYENDPQNELKEEHAKGLLLYFFNENFMLDRLPSLYVLTIEEDFALRDFFVVKYEKYVDLMFQIHTWETLIPQIASFFIVSFIAYFIMPIILKNGRTVGKLIMGLGLVNKFGYEVNVPQLLLRFIFPFLLILTLFFIGGTILFLGLGLFVLISYMMVVFSKERKAPHDLLAGTLVINTKTSVWYKNAKEEEKFLQELKKVTPINFDDINQEDFDLINK